MWSLSLALILAVLLARRQKASLALACYFILVLLCCSACAVKFPLKSERVVRSERTTDEVTTMNEDGTE